MNSAPSRRAFPQSFKVPGRWVGSRMSKAHEKPWNPLDSLAAPWAANYLRCGTSIGKDRLSPSFAFQVRLVATQWRATKLRSFALQWRATTLRSFARQRRATKLHSFAGQRLALTLSRRVASRRSASISSSVSFATTCESYYG